MSEALPEQQHYHDEGVFGSGLFACWQPPYQHYRCAAAAAAAAAAANASTAAAAAAAAGGSQQLSLCT